MDANGINDPPTIAHLAELSHFRRQKQEMGKVGTDVGFHVLIVSSEADG